MMSVGHNFLCGRPHGAAPSTVHRRPPEPDSLPLRVDVVSGWPLVFFVSGITCRLSSSSMLCSPGILGIVSTIDIEWESVVWYWCLQELAIDDSYCYLSIICLTN